MVQRRELKQRAGQLIGRELRGKWQLESLLGVGGMASVFAAKHRNGNRVAIKLLHPEPAADTALRARFLREGYAANRVGHPGVCAVLDDDVTEDGLVFLVLELLEGETLHERWGRACKRLQVTDVLSISDAVLDILAAAHDRGIVHRDLKPENIFLTSDGGVRLLDFGIARLADSTQGTRTDMMLGTPAYMAPEHALAKWDDIDGRADLFSLGATMFTLLTGEYVHAGAGALEQLSAAATVKARPIAFVMPGLSVDVARLVDRALAFDREARFPDARSMRAAIAGSRARRSDPAPATVALRSEAATTALPARALPPRQKSVLTAPLTPVHDVLPPTVRDPPSGDELPPASESARRPSSVPVAATVPPPSTRRGGLALKIAAATAVLGGAAWTIIAVVGASQAPSSSRTTASVGGPHAPIAARDAAIPPVATAAPVARPVMSGIAPSPRATTSVAAPAGHPKRQRVDRSNEGLRDF